MSTDHGTSSSHDIANEAGGPTDASTLNAATAFRTEKARKRAAIKAAWKNHKALTAIRRIVIPSIGYGAAAHFFAAHSPAGASALWSVGVGAASVPVTSSIEWVGGKMGEAKGLGHNFFKGTLLQQVFSEISGTATAKTLAVCFLVASQPLWPTFVNLKNTAVDTASAAGQWIDDTLRGHYRSSDAGNANAVKVTDSKTGQEFIVPVPANFSQAPAAQRTLGL